MLNPSKIQHRYVLESSKRTCIYFVALLAKNANPVIIAIKRLGILQEQIQNIQEI